MRFLVLAFTFLLVLTASAAQYKKPFGQLKEEQKFKDYTVRIYRNEEPPPDSDKNPDHRDGFGCFEILRFGKQVYFQKGVIFKVEKVGDQHDANNHQVFSGRSTIGDKQPTLIMSEVNGGNNSLCDYYIFQIGDTFKFIAKIKDTGGGEFRDLRSNGDLDLITCDVLTFEGWNCCEAASPQPTVILRYQGGHYLLDLEMMKKPAPTQQRLEKLAGEIKPLFASKEMKGDLNNELQVPPRLWGKMLDLIYSGNMDSAWKLCDLSWPAKHPGKTIFLKEFKKQLATSPYYAAINQSSFQNVAVHKN